MANLEFCDIHNMVVYLQKPEGSEGFHQIVDFLNTSHIRYALTKNPTIYVSLIQQFWQTTTASTLDNGGMEIIATIDGKVKVVTEAFVRMHLKLEDSYAYKPASIGVDVRHGGAATTVTRLDAGQGSDRVVALETYLKQTKKVYGAAYTKLIMKVKKLEKTVKTNQARRRAKIAVFDDEEDLEDPSKHGGRYDQDMEFNLDFDAAKEVSTAEKEVSTAKPVFTTGAAVTTASVDVSLVSPTRRVSTVDDITMVETLVYIRRSVAKDKGKGIMTKSEPVQTKIKLQQEQERLGYEAVVRLQKELDEEERQRMARVHEAAQSFTEEE
nr:xylulose kinase-1 [Tanacetum cinerariifolium]